MNIFNQKIKENTVNELAVKEREDKEKSREGIGHKIFLWFKHANKNIINFIIIAVMFFLMVVLPSGIYIAVFTVVFYVILNKLVDYLVGRIIAVHVDITNNWVCVREFTQSALSKYDIIDLSGQPAEFKRYLNAGREKVVFYDAIDDENYKIYVNPVFNDIDLYTQGKEFIKDTKLEIVKLFRANMKHDAEKEYEAAKLA